MIGVSLNKHPRGRNALSPHADRVVRHFNRDSCTTNAGREPRASPPESLEGIQCSFLQAVVRSIDGHDDDAGNRDRKEDNEETKERKEKKKREKKTSGIISAATPRERSSLSASGRCSAGTAPNVASSRARARRHERSARFCRSARVVNKALSALTGPVRSADARRNRAARVGARSVIVPSEASRPWNHALLHAGLILQLQSAI